MRSYTLHLPRDARAGESHELDRAQLVPDGFSWAAFAFTVLWFFYHRLWIAGIGVLIGLAAAAFAGHALGLSPFMGFLVTLLLSILIGLEASSLRRWTLARRGRPVRDAVVARDAAEAETKAMTRWLDPASAPRTLAPAAFAGAASRPSEPVIGLFPFNEGRR
ncbi:DUF2628 domain-containing protein [Methylobacterium soli]|uniref:DUF2628 domain-containing protein n=1 Tax=Methylobacterium soli TaxID=553447 RepID=A0A6L3SUM8_9HYPH|nr:DUF2628 domain-containing protein [Methylobacterium soli]KAB1074162.1 DUF2628 domain-containing protein [Methylobacterium soli]GJE43595.1 hypothetical protein AEGHOMDF_2774 [Methylobacterium soli]